MGHKRRILTNPKFNHLKKSWFDKDSNKDASSNSAAQEVLKAQPQEEEVQTPVLSAAQKVEEVEEVPVEEKPKPKMTIKKSPPKKRAATRKPRAKKATTKRKSANTKV